MKKTIYYQLHKQSEKLVPFYKKGGSLNGAMGDFNDKVTDFVLKDQNRKSTGHGGIYFSKVPYKLITLNELLDYNNEIGDTNTFLYKIKRKIGFKRYNILNSYLECTLKFL